jgi:uncharacterized MAPEG superfamily protein
LCCLLLGVSPQWTANWLWVYFAARVAHMALYYADLRNPRSAALVVGVVAQLGLLALAVMALLR